MTSSLARSKRHIEIALPAGMSYRAGDYLSVLPQNPRRDVERALHRFGLGADTQIVNPQGYRLRGDVPDGLSCRRRRGCSRATSSSPSRPPACRSASSPRRRAARPTARRSRRWPSPRRTTPRSWRNASAYSTSWSGSRPASSASAPFSRRCPPLRARQYSISSSPLRDPGRCSLTLSVLDAPALSGTGRHRGVASTYLAALEDGRAPAGGGTPVAGGLPPAGRSGDADHHDLRGAAASRRSMASCRSGRSRRRTAGRSDRRCCSSAPTIPTSTTSTRTSSRPGGTQASSRCARPFSSAPADGVTYVQHRVWQ